MKLFTFKTISLSLLLFAVCSCSTASKVLNPFYETPPPEASYGQPNDSALTSDDKEDSARKALEAMAKYNRANPPQPNNPVLHPAIVRMMWVPEHLNRHGDLIPAHYYYIKLLPERWAVTDAFEIEGQLDKHGSGAASTIPYAVKSSKGFQ